MAKSVCLFECNVEHDSPTIALIHQAGGRQPSLRSARHPRAFINILQGESITLVINKFKKVEGKFTAVHVFKTTITTSAGSLTHNNPFVALFMIFFAISLALSPNARQLLASISSRYNVLVHTMAQFIETECPIFLLTDELNLVPDC